jgi:hypothetical protein
MTKSLPDSLCNGGWVYFLLDTSLMITKIGSTSSILNRWNQIKPYNLSAIIMFFIRVKGASLANWNYQNLEKSLHEQFDDRRIAYEWFELSYEDYLDVLKEMRVTENYIMTTTMNKLKIAFDENPITYVESLENLAHLPIQEFEVNVTFTYNYAEPGEIKA